MAASLPFQSGGSYKDESEFNSNDTLRHTMSNANIGTEKLDTPAKQSCNDCNNSPKQAVGSQKNAVPYSLNLKGTLTNYLEESLTAATVAGTRESRASFTPHHVHCIPVQKIHAP